LKVQVDAGLGGTSGLQVDAGAGLTVGGSKGVVATVNVGQPAGSLTETVGANPLPTAELKGNVGGVQVGGHTGGEKASAPENTTGGNGDTTRQPIGNVNPGSDGNSVGAPNPNGNGVPGEINPEAGRPEQAVFFVVNSSAVEQAAPSPLVTAVLNPLQALDGAAGAGRTFDDHVGATYEDEADEADEADGTAPLSGAVEPGTDKDQDPDLPDLQGAGLAADFLPADLDALNASLQQFLDQLGNLSAQLVRSPMAPWVLAVTVAVVAGETARRRWRRAAPGLMLAGSESACWDWCLGLPEPDSDS
jgi:hypothetical protein